MPGQPPEYPAGVRYTSCKLPDGVTYVVLLQLDDDSSNPLAAVPAFGEVQGKIQSWIDGRRRRGTDPGRVLPAVLDR